MADKIRDPQFSQHLKKLQRIKKLKSKEVARQLGIIEQTYSSYFRGITSPPLEIIVKLKYILDVTWEELFSIYIPSEHLIVTAEDREIDAICLKIKKKCKTDKDFKKSLFYFTDIMKLESSIDPQKKLGEGNKKQAG